MIKIEHLSYSFPQKELYQDISFSLEADAHCAFIGSNGSGKSTLVDMILHPDTYMFTGKIKTPKHFRFGYVSQFPDFDMLDEKTVYEYISEPFVTKQAEIDAICKEMETASELDSLLELYQAAFDDFTAMDGDNYVTNITKKLNLANLSKYENTPVKSLSGGEFKLVSIIREMLTCPHMLVMDEPDVFLDFDNLNSLKNLINSHKGLLLVITHNRYLLHHCFNKILHLENKLLQEFDGRYVDYNFSLLQGKIELLELAMADEEEIKRNEKIIERLRIAATNYSDPAKGKALGARVSLLKRLEERRIKPPFLAIKEPAISFPYADDVIKNVTILPETVFANDSDESANAVLPSDSDESASNVLSSDSDESTNSVLANGSDETVILDVTDYSVAFDDTLLEHVTFSLTANEKVAIIGPNGTGKTTLLRDIYKYSQNLGTDSNTDDSKSAISFHKDAKIGFLSQIQGETLTEKNTVKDEFFELGFSTFDEIQEFLLQYGFDEEFIYQRIHALSGGEKNMLQLAKISATKTNFLLLDEPTSHLDMYAQMALEKAVSAYKGAVLMVSHDFYSIVNCVDYAYVIEDKTLRKISMRKFRKTIYAKHFSKDYLQLEDQKKSLETRIELAMKTSDFELAKSISEELEALLPLL